MKCTFERLWLTSEPLTFSRTVNTYKGKGESENETDHNVIPMKTLPDVKSPHKPETETKPGALRGIETHIPFLILQYLETISSPVIGELPPCKVASSRDCARALQQTLSRPPPHLLPQLKGFKFKPPTLAECVLGTGSALYHQRDHNIRNRRAFDAVLRHGTSNFM
ncbi:hypothetical protein EVAR_16094_1 [Eumeta japonica]|uniref:Uncharacterized protein n=1 Tax=Eumeta variegata TaxID=151549 RepID=A0A4C1UIE2_EUMVA|nr:hypothetical protein EVAR_16094_1 [Eumeta japonica]